MPSLIRFSLNGIALVTLLTACGDFLTDGATRMAYDIEAGADALKRSDAERHSIQHLPEAEPGGCAGAYKVQLSAASALLIWCKDEAMNVTTSHTTTSHLRFVEVQETLMIDKAAKELLFIDLEKRNGKIAVVGLR